MAKTKTNLAQSVQKPQLTIANTKLKIRIDDLKTIQPLTENQKLFFDDFGRINVSKSPGMVLMIDL
jgi:hypothetical protein